jgi:hypothetical protein
MELLIVMPRISTDGAEIGDLDGCRIEISNIGIEATKQQVL